MRSIYLHVLLLSHACRPIAICLSGVEAFIHLVQHDYQSLRLARSNMCVASMALTWHCTGLEIAQMEASEARSKLQLIQQTIKSFKSTYHAYKAKSYIDTPQRPWHFLNEAIFDVLDATLHRSGVLQDAFLTQQQFSRLERVELGGMKVKIFQIVL